MSHREMDWSSLRLQICADPPPEVLNIGVEEFGFSDPADIVFAEDGRLEHTWKV